MHGNSLKAYCEENIKLSKRESVILDWMFDKSGSFTDREIQIKMGFAERNQVQPRITELIKKNLLFEVGKTKCKLTGKTVRLVSKKREITDEYK
jgi:predicted transcriptional regulator